MSIKVVALTMGDPAGIGPELLLKTLSLFNSLDDVVPVLVGHSSVFDHPKLDAYRVDMQPWTCRADVAAGHVYMMDVGDPLDHLDVATPSVLGGQSSHAWVEAATAMCLKKEADAMVTAPLCKESLDMAGFEDTGHTTLLKRLTRSKNVSMAFYTERLKTILTTVHVPFIKVPSLLSQERLIQTYENAQLFAKMLGISSPKIALAGLNPRASENGLFGDEESRVLTPFVTAIQKTGTHVDGPLPPDTLYRRAYDGDFDIVISLYHDQGLIPIKLIGFEEAVNVTVGLPFVRTSPDHGTAFDIAYQDRASTTSFAAAIRLALELK